MTGTPSFSVADIAEYRQEAAGLLNGLEVDLSQTIPKGEGLRASFGAIEAVQTSKRTEPFRTLHHFACTGGTLFAKLAAALPNVSLLSELHPHSPLVNARAAFRPSDIPYHLMASGVPSASSVTEHAFMAALLATHKQLAQRGSRLIVRDHAHSDFCVANPCQESTLIRLLSASAVNVLPIVTVRHPADSFASAQKAGFFYFDLDFAAYCRRYHQFLDAIDSVLIVRYEDMVDQPQVWLEKICSAWGLEFTPESTELFSLYQFSGDSGRTRDNLTKHPPRSEAAHFRRSRSKTYVSLLARMGY